MTLRQLRYLIEVIAQGFNITAAAATLHTAQPGVSKQIIELEHELGTQILLRRGNRIIGLTKAGEHVARLARRMLLDAESLRNTATSASGLEGGRLVLGTTHAQARYVLPYVIQRFKSRYPAVQLVIRQENESRVPDLVAAGELDIGVSAEPPTAHNELLILPCYQLPRSVITPAHHPLLREKRLTLESIAHYPIITLDATFAGGRKVLQAFSAHGLSINLAMSAIDADAIKSYVALGLGVAILPGIAFMPARDRELRALDASHLFEPTLVCLQIQRAHYVPNYILDFIQMLAPQWQHSAIVEAVRTGKPPPGKIKLYPPTGQTAQARHPLKRQIQR